MGLNQNHSRGGSRPGAGRPQGSTKETTKKMVSFRLSLDAIKRLDELAEKTGQTKARILEKVIESYGE